MRVEETEEKLLEVSGKARERAGCGDGGYARATAANAAAAAEQGVGGVGDNPNIHSKAAAQLRSVSEKCAHAC